MQKLTKALFLLVSIFFFPLTTFAQASEDADPSVTGPSNFTPSSPLTSCGAGGEIYCNGELVNSVGTGVGGVDESVLQNVTAPIMNTLGAGCQSTPAGTNIRCADEFVIPSGSNFDISSFIFYAYQTGETTLPTITSLNVRIFSGGDPSTGTLFCGDTTTNLLNAATDPGIYRVTETTTGTIDNRRIQELDVAVPADCPAQFIAGTYWLDWQNAGTGASGPWSPPIASTHGPTIVLKDKDGLSRSSVLTVTGNALQSVDGGATYAALLDSGVDQQAQGLPFNIIGVVILPVELTSFDATSTGSSVVLSWETASELNNAGFEVQHMVDDDFVTVAFVDGLGTSTEGQSYAYTLNDLNAGRHQFRLKQIDFDGSFEYSELVEALVDIPEGFVVYNAYPNPFNPNTNIEFVVENDQRVDVSLFDIFGKEVGTYYSSEVRANQSQKVSLDLGDLPSGNYILKVTGQVFNHSQMVQLLK